jgi:hypothetical protein
VKRFQTLEPLHLFLFVANSVCLIAEVLNAILLANS